MLTMNPRGARYDTNDLPEWNWDRLAWVPVPILIVSERYDGDLPRAQHTNGAIAYLLGIDPSFLADGRRR